MEEPIKSREKHYSLVLYMLISPPKKRNSTNLSLLEFPHSSYQYLLSIATSIFIEEIVRRLTEAAQADSNMGLNIEINALDLLLLSPVSLVFWPTSFFTWDLAPLHPEIYLDFHWVCTSMATNADQWKWRQIRISAVSEATILLRFLWIRLEILAWDMASSHGILRAGAWLPSMKRWTTSQQPTPLPPPPPPHPPTRPWTS